MIAAVFWLLLAAQSSQTGLVGEIVDPSGKAVPHATVKLLSVETNAFFSSASGQDGRYLFNEVRPGRYSVTVEADGFQKIIRPAVTLAAGERIRLDFTLTIGSIEESLTIRADAPLLRTESADLGQVIDQRIIGDLPLNGRSFISLAGLVPGVALPSGSAFPRINGGRPRTNEYLFDGVTVLQPEPGQVTFMPVVDAIQEFKIETNGAPAERDPFTGGVVNLTTKSGTNEFHGTAFEFLRNEALNARNLFAPPRASSPGKPLFRRNQFGFVLGGPIVHDKTFFFVDYQGSRQAIARVHTSTVPTALQRQGIFSEAVEGLLPEILDPATRRPFSNNIIPENTMDPAAVSLLSRYPLPTSGGTANNYRRTGKETDNQNQYDMRVDHRFSAMNSLFVRYSSFNAFAGFGTQRPNRLRDPNPPNGQRTTSRYFYTDAFVAAPQFTIGTSSRNPIQGPGFQDIDVALIKRVKFRERYTAEVRAEVFNLTNTPPLGAPNTVLGSPGFGSLTSAGDPRVVQLAAAMHF